MDTGLVLYAPSRFPRRTRWPVVPGPAQEAGPPSPERQTSRQQDYRARVTAFPGGHLFSPVTLHGHTGRVPAHHGGSGRAALPARNPASHEACEAHGALFKVGASRPVFEVKNPFRSDRTAGGWLCWGSLPHAGCQADSFCSPNKTRKR